MNTAVNIKNITCWYGKNKALSDVTLTVQKGDYLGIMGPNGGGKSTLLKSILGFVKPQSGTIEIYGEKLSAKTKNFLGYVPQFTYIDRKFPISVKEVIYSGQLKGFLHPFYHARSENGEKALFQLERLGIQDLASRQISQLSGGEFQRLLIARALAASPKILLLDEPTASVDPASRNTIYRLLNDINKEMTIIMVTHDTGAISSSIKKLACLNQTLVYHGEPKLTNEIITTMYGCPIDLIGHGIPHRVLADEAHQCPHGMGDNCPICNAGDKND